MGRLRSSWMAAMLVGAWLMIPGADVHAQSGSKEAQAHFNRGVQLYEENDYRSALVEFRRAYKIAPSFRLLYNIAMVNMQLQDYAAALQAFEQYLAEGGQAVPAKRRTEVSAEIDKLKTRVARVEVACDVAGAEVTVDDVTMGTTPLAQPLVLSSGRRKVTVSKKGYAPVTRMVDVVGGDSVRVSLDLQSQSAAAPESSGTSAPLESTAAVPVSKPAPGSVATAPSSQPTARPFPWVPWAVTGVLLVGTAVTGTLALRASSDLKSKKDTADVGADDLDSAAKSSSRWALVTDVLGAATLVAGGVSLYLTLAKGEGSNTSQASVRSTQLGFGPSSVVLRGSF